MTVACCDHMSLLVKSVAGLGSMYLLPKGGFSDRKT